MLTGAQFGLYNRLWNRVLVVWPDADREAMHKQLGLPASRKDWGNRDLDEWKKACLAISAPGDLDAQLEDGEKKRRLYVIRGLLARLGEAESYAETTAVRMHLQPPLALIDADDLEKVIVALRLEVGRKRRQAKERAAIAPENIPF